MKPSSIAIITAVNQEQQKVVAELKPSDKETGWISCVTTVTGSLMGKECMVIPSENSYASAVAIPIPIEASLLGTIKDTTPHVEVNGTTFKCLKTINLVGEDIGKSGLIVPAANVGQFVLVGVIK
jgi:hypothetical protein